MGVETPARYLFRPTPRVDALVAYVRRIVAETGNAPSYSMIRDALGFYDNGTIRRAVKAAEAKGLLTLGEYSGGRGPRCGQRIRLGRPEEADTVKIKMGRDIISELEGQ